MTPFADTSGLKLTAGPGDPKLEERGREPFAPEEKQASRDRCRSDRLRALLQLPLALARKWRLAAWKARARWLPETPLPTRLPWGDRWLAWNDVVGRRVWLGPPYEPEETAFFHKFVTPGMVVAECGAHQGYFTLLLSRLVGPAGRVLAVEPSSRERDRLKRHLLLSRRQNVTVHPVALGPTVGTARLHVCDYETGCNSLRPPAVAENTRAVEVALTTLDALLPAQGGRLDLLKLDAEGAELGILQGAEATLRQARPVVFCELADIRTGPWGYPAAAIYSFLQERGYSWFAIGEGGALVPYPPQNHIHMNLVALPAAKTPA